MDVKFNPPPRWWIHFLFSLGTWFNHQHVADLQAVFAFLQPVGMPKNQTFGGGILPVELENGRRWGATGGKQVWLKTPLFPAAFFWGRATEKVFWKFPRVPDYVPLIIQQCHCNYLTCSFYGWISRPFGWTGIPTKNEDAFKTISRAHACLVGIFLAVFPSHHGWGMSLLQMWGLSCHSLSKPWKGGDCFWVFFRWWIQAAGSHEFQPQL